MIRTIWRVIVLGLLCYTSLGVMAQDTTTSTALDLPSSYLLQGFSYEAQRWNNCGPATVTNALSFFGYDNNQVRAQTYLKPNTEDKNVSPWQMINFVNTQVPEIPVYALQRFGGSLDTLRMLIANDFPVIIEEGYDPPELGAGWMGHYLLMIGYNDATQTFTTHDSYNGANYSYSYEYIERYWQHFNYTYLVIYNTEREADLLALLGEDADPQANVIRAMMRAIEQAEANNNDAFAWFNIGSNYVQLAQMAIAEGDDDAALSNYNNATIAFDRARNTGNLPWRMLWYQFGPYESYYYVAQHGGNEEVATLRYSDILQLASITIDNCKNPDGVCYVEETYYYAGLARQAQGDTQRALANFNTALQVNSNYQPAIDARSALQATDG